MSLSNYEYRLFFKKLTNLSGRSLSSPQTRIKSFTLDVDALKKATSTFQILQVPQALEVGDVVGMYDSFGTILYLGVVNYIDNEQIQTDQMNDIFEDEWLWNNPRETTLEETLKTIITNDYQNTNDTLMNSIYGVFDLNTISNTTQTLQTQEDRYVTEFSSFLYDIYEKYSIQLRYNIPYEAQRPSIDIGIPQFTKLTISDNTAIFRNFNITTNVYETNKLIVYSEESGAYRETWYATKNGITDNPSSLDRLQKIKTNIVFSDDAISILKASSLRNQMYNHEITCEMIYDNNLLSFEDLRIGQPVDLFYRGNYYDTILTGYTISIAEKSAIETITLKFGLVRTSLTGKLYKRLAKRYGN